MFTCPNDDETMESNTYEVRSHDPHKMHRHICPACGYSEWR